MKNKTKEKKDVRKKWEKWAEKMERRSSTAKEGKITFVELKPGELMTGRHDANGLIKHVVTHRRRDGAATERNGDS